MREEAGHDGVLLMDRVMSTSLQLAPDLLDLLAVGCVVIAAKQVRARAPPTPHPPHPTPHPHPTPPPRDPRIPGGSQPCAVRLRHAA